MSEKVKNVSIGLLLLALCTFFFYQTFDIEPIDQAGIEGIGPEFFPQIILIITFLLSLGMIVKNLLQKDGKVEPEEQSEEGKKEKRKKMTWVWLIFLFFFVYVLLLDDFGFIISSFLFISATYLLVAPPMSGVKKLRTLAFLLIIVIGLKFFFQGVLDVPLPSGII